MDWKRNCNEWINFANTNLRLKDVYELQYNTTPDFFLKGYETKNWKDYKTNGFLQWLIKKENKDALDYFVLAKKAESTQLVDPDPWDTATTINKQFMHKLAVQAEQKTASSIPLFLKERYAFQSIKMNFYSGPYTPKSAAQKLYKTYLQKSNSIVSGWVLAYISKMERDANKRTQYLLQAFDRTEEKKGFAYVQLNEEMLKDYISKAASKHEQALAYTLLAIKNDGRALAEIQKVYAAEPACKYLPLLVTREINKLEHWLWSAKWLGFPNYSYVGDHDYNDQYYARARKRDEQYLNLFFAFLNKLPGGGEQALFLKLAKAHLYCMQGKFETASQLLATIKTENKNINIQKLVEQFLIAVHTKDVSMEETQSSIVEIVNKLVALQPKLLQQTNNRNYDYYDNDFNETSDDLSELLLILSKQFEKKGNTLVAGLFYNKANVLKNNYDGWGGDSAGYGCIAYFDRNGTPADIDKLIAFKHKKNKTEFEKLMSPKVWGMDDMYKDLKGTILFRQQKYTEALEVFKTMKPTFWAKYYAYEDNLPTTSITHTGELIPSETSAPKRYATTSKKLIVQDIVSTLDALKKATKPEEQAQLYYKLGNAYYNTSYWGKGWMMFSYGNSSNEMGEYSGSDWNWCNYTFYPNSIKYRNHYYRLQHAQAMYEKAFALSRNNELKAKSLIMLSTCDKYGRYVSEIKPGKKPANTPKVDYLAKVLKDFSNTEAFRQAASRCADVEEYVRKHKKH